jgi:hypothetical protein
MERFVYHPTGITAEKGGCGREECSASSGYDEHPTFGIGFDGKGYFREPCAKCARAFEKLHPEYAPCWPYEEKTDRPGNCPVCNQKPELVTGAAIYPHRPDLEDKHFWRCSEGHAYVGCHYESTRPLGTLATAAMRKARRRAHAAFDPLARWFSSRQASYQWLAKKLDLAVEDCHIGHFDEATCSKVISICLQFAKT